MANKLITCHSGRHTLGEYLSYRLVESGVREFFTVPGDYILCLLDDLIKNTQLRMIGCCNELVAGYASDGVCRATGGLGVVVCTYMVGGLSLINAVAGAYSDSLSLLVVSGGPNSNDGHERHLIHHTIGEPELYQSAKCFEPVVCGTFVVRHIQDFYLIDDAIDLCISKKKPVYLEIACNLSPMTLPTPPLRQGCHGYCHRQSDRVTLSTAAHEIINRLTTSKRSVVLCGAKVRRADAEESVLRFSQALGCGVVIMPDAKGLYPEQGPSSDLFMGVYWGAISSPSVINEIMLDADLVIAIGPVFNDYTTVGWSNTIDPEKMILVDVETTTIGESNTRFAHVAMKDLLDIVAAKVTPEIRAKTSPAFEQQRKACKDVRTAISATVKAICDSSVESHAPLTLAQLRALLQQQLTQNSSLIVETGDAWFIGQAMSMPEGCQYHAQMQYGSIGWSVGALLGVGVANHRSDFDPSATAAHRKNIIALVGDGSFQMTAQAISSTIRYNIDCTIIILNNTGYTIESQIHDNVYNDIQNWDYAGLVGIFDDHRGNSGMDSDESAYPKTTAQKKDALASTVNKERLKISRGFKVTSAAELVQVLKECPQYKGLKLIECLIDRNDCSPELVIWGKKVAAANMRGEVKK